ncbi:hypothetical protein E2C01_016511 [Portunus trituberculatus]|uniref:Uncharacterized protein n=1 Tax=Portunus trituberculatus TaxID=210409 RepID=A0A5B7DR39_PORTR|nr:hypothetical protein [Portunus trituberculatus]
MKQDEQEQLQADINSIPALNPAIHTLVPQVHHLFLSPAHCPRSQSNANALQIGDPKLEGYCLYFRRRPKLEQRLGPLI